MRLFILALGLAVGASAQPAEPAPPSSASGWGSPTRAVGLSLGAPIAAAVVGTAFDHDDGLAAAAYAVGMLVAPSAGNLAQRDWRDALVGTGLRTAGVTAVGVAFGRALSNDRADALDTILAGTGAVMFSAGAVYDVLTAAVDRGAPPAVEVAPGGAGLAVRVAL